MKGFHWGIIRESLYSIYFEIPKNEIVKEIDSLRLSGINSSFKGLVTRLQKLPPITKIKTIEKPWSSNSSQKLKFLLLRKQITTNTCCITTITLEQLTN